MDTWPNHLAPRVTFSLAHGLYVFLYKMYGSAGFDPGTSPTVQCPIDTPLANTSAHIPCYVIQNLYIYIVFSCYVEKGAGRGLSPDPGSIITTYDHWRGYNHLTLMVICIIWAHMHLSWRSNLVERLL